ncbi:MAG: type II secretion system GspH family protein [Proteobacteria bacterium]|nr:type II secretion system GspH family protein [Pseudomonadota bacterium]
MSKSTLLINTSRTSGRPHRGFTLMEVIAVLIIMAIIAVGLSVSYDSGFHDLEQETDLLRSRIRYAQSRALGNNSPFGIACTGGQYFLFSGLSTATTHVFPGEDQPQYSLPNGITANSFIISFDGWGVPYSNAAQATALTIATTITLTSSQGGKTESSTTTVTPLTGFVP